MQQRLRAGVNPTNSSHATDIKPGMSDRARTVLHVSPDIALAQSRTRALTSIGYHVVCVQTVVAALFEISMGRCGILLLCHKLDQTGRCTLAEYFHCNCPYPWHALDLTQRDFQCNST
jgi:hypothetical protein